MPNVDLQLLGDVRRAASDALAERARVTESLARRGAEIESLHAEADRLQSTGDAAQAQLLRERANAAAAQRSAESARLNDLNSNWRDIIGRLRDRIDPCDADPAIPLILLPVRIETRYTDDRTSVRIRIYPDDIHIDQLDRGLSAEESSAGQAYWLAAAGNPDDAETAWTTLRNSVSQRRALWVALATKPDNFDAWRAGAPPVFPDVHPLTKRAAFARLLPDRFVAVAIQNNQRAVATGNPVPPEVVLGLLSDDGSAQVDTAGVKVPAGTEWIFDYDQAVEAGLAITLRLATPGAKIDRLFVVGVRSTLSPQDAASQLGSLLQSHRCTGGLAFVAQGTATNNTSDNSTTWQRQPNPHPPLHLFNGGPMAGSNAAVVAAALGLNPSDLDGVEHADDLEQPLAQAMNSALWPATWDAFLDRATEADETGAHASLSDGTREAARALFRSSVKGRGPLPAMRVGSQPYGILPVSNLSDGVWKPDANNLIHNSLLPLLRNLRGWWNASAPSVPRITAGAKIDDIFSEIMGSSPVCQGLRVRTVIADEARKTAQSGGFLNIDTSAIEALMESIVYASIGIDGNAVHALGSLETKSRPLSFPMVHESDTNYMNLLLAGNAPAVQSVLQALLGLAWDAAQREVASAAPRRNFGDLLALATTVPAATRDRLLAVSVRAETAPSDDLHAEANNLASQVGESGKTVFRSYAPVQAYRTSFLDVAQSSTVSAAKSGIAAAGAVMWFRASAHLAEVREAIQKLLQSTIDERRILFAETLDLASHRLDAWMTGIVEQRRAALRSANPAGVTIGAFGWVENIAPGVGGRPNGGYIHAPSLDHAATSGILRSAFLTHNPDAGATGPFAVDLSSERVRTALHLIDGMRQGQPLGALLGYRFERRLHEARLDRLTLTLRGLAPLTAQRLSDRGDNVPAPASENLAANNVVDGLRLIERYNSTPGAPAIIQAALNAPPADNPYIKPADWPALTPDEWSKFQSIIAETQGDCDAASDLLLAEAVHQIVRGNTSRAAAALNAAGGGDTPPSEPEFIKTPNPGVPFSHRVLIVAPPPGASWNSARPRAAAEPSLETWATQRLGPASQIVVAVLQDGTRLLLEDAAPPFRLCALDFIYESADRRRLEQRLRAAFAALPIDTPFAERRDPAWPAGLRAFGELAVFAGSLRTVLTSARPARPVDFARPNDPLTRGVSDASFQAVNARATIAQGSLTICHDTLANALVPAAGNPDPITIFAALEAIAAFGVVVPMVEGENLFALAQVALAEAQRRLTLADKALAAGTFDLESASAASQAIFGDGFWMIPAVDSLGDGDLFNAAFGPAGVTTPRAEIRRFIRDIGSVRPSISRLSEALLLGDALARPSLLRVAQLCPEQRPWVGGAFDAQQPSSDEPITNVVLDVPDGYSPDQPTVALSIDQWTDVVPLRTAQGQNAQRVDDLRATGVALNAASASSRPPQTILLAVSPNGERWTTDSLTALLTDTLDLVKSRAVTLERVAAAGRILPALYQQSWSLQGEKVIDWRYIATNFQLKAALAYVKETP